MAAPESREAIKGPPAVIQTPARGDNLRKLRRKLPTKDGLVTLPTRHAKRAVGIALGAEVVDSGGVLVDAGDGRREEQAIVASEAPSALYVDTRVDEEDSPKAKTEIILDEILGDGRIRTTYQTPEGGIFSITRGDGVLEPLVIDTVKFFPGGEQKPVVAILSAEPLEEIAVGENTHVDASSTMSVVDKIVVTGGVFRGRSVGHADIASGGEASLYFLTDGTIVGPDVKVSIMKLTGELVAIGPEHGTGETPVAVDIGKIAEGATLISKGETAINIREAEGKIVVVDPTNINGQSKEDGVWHVKPHDRETESGLYTPEDLYFELVRDEAKRGVKRLNKKTAIAAATRLFRHHGKRNFSIGSEAFPARRVAVRRAETVQDPSVVDATGEADSRESGSLADQTEGFVPAALEAELARRAAAQAATPEKDGSAADVVSEGPYIIGSHQPFRNLGRRLRSFGRKGVEIVDKARKKERKRKAEEALVVLLAVGTVATGVGAIVLNQKDSEPNSPGDTPSSSPSTRHTTAPDGRISAPPDRVPKTGVLPNETDGSTQELSPVKKLKQIVTKTPSGEAVNRTDFTDDQIFASTGEDASDGFLNVATRINGQVAKTLGGEADADQFTPGMHWTLDKASLSYLFHRYNLRDNLRLNELFDQINGRDSNLSKAVIDAQNEPVIEDILAILETEAKKASLAVQVSDAIDRRWVHFNKPGMRGRKDSIVA